MIHRLTRAVSLMLSNKRAAFLVILNFIILSANWCLLQSQIKSEQLLQSQISILRTELESVKVENTQYVEVDRTFRTPKENATTSTISKNSISKQGITKGVIGAASNVNNVSSILQSILSNRTVAQIDMLQAAIKNKIGNPYALTDQEVIHSRTAHQVNYAEIRKTYQIPKIQYTNLINCDALIANSSKELANARTVLKTKPKVPIYEETYMKWFENCDEFKRQRGYIAIPLSEEEENFPLAFSISMFRDVELAERLLRAIYQPQNLYCIHIDIKASLLVHRTVRGLANCFDNVFISSRLDKIKWGDTSVLFPDLNCMHDFERHYRGRWKYLINLTGQEFPLRSNWELVQIAKIFNGSNDIAGSVKRMEMDRVTHVWRHRWSKTYQQTIFYDTMLPKAPPKSYNITFYKGELHGLFTQRMVSFVLHNNISRDYLNWCLDSGHASEHYWNTLNYNKHLQAPGGYIGPPDEAEIYSSNPIIRAKHWQDQNYIPRECQGKLVRGICIYGVGDIPWLSKRPELFANKFHMTYEYLAYDCMEQRHRERIKLGSKVPLDANLYRNLPTVKYSRKNGYLNINR